MAHFSRPSALPGFMILLMFSGLVYLSTASALSCNSTTKNCLPSCRTSCRTAKCLYQCHYDTTYQMIRLAITPPGGPNLDAFFAAVANLTNLLEDNAVVRIEPLGIYRGKTEVADYVATFLHPVGLAQQSRIVGVSMINFVNTGNVSAATVNLMFSGVDDPTNHVTNFTMILFNLYNDTTQKIFEGDWNFLRLPQAQEDLTYPDPRVSANSSAAIVTTVCAVNERVCRPLGFSDYANLTDCLTFVSSIPRIAPYGIQGNNQFCRFLHTAYATVEPKVHCPHIGRSGGGMCVDQVYTDYYKVFPPGTFIGRL